jgi:hypothetical protein
VRRLQDAALLAETNQSRCPLDLGFPEAIGGDVKPRSPQVSADGTSVGKAPPGSPLLAVGGASYRCDYDRGGKPVTLVVVAVPEGQQTAAAVGALSTPLEDAGLDRAIGQQLVDAAKGAKPGAAVAAQSGTASAASATLPGGGAAAVAVVATQGGVPAGDLTDAAKKLAAELKG